MAFPHPLPPSPTWSAPEYLQRALLTHFQPHGLGEIDSNPILGLVLWPNPESIHASHSPDPGGQSQRRTVPQIRPIRANELSSGTFVCTIRKENFLFLLWKESGKDIATRDPGNHPVAMRAEPVGQWSDLRGNQTVRWKWLDAGNIIWTHAMSNTWSEPYPWTFQLAFLLTPVWI